MKLWTRKFSGADASLHAISLCLAVLLWYFVVGEDQVDMNVEIPLEIINLPSNLVISNQFKKEIEVSVRGPRSLVQNLRNEPIYRSVDLAKAEAGAFVVENDAESIAFPRLVTVLRLQPTSIVLLLDELIEKRFPIDPVTVGKVAEGYVLRALTLKPDAINVTGPKTVLSSSMALKTNLIYLDGLEKSADRQVRLDLSPELQKLTGEIVVSANIMVEEATRQVTVEKVPVLLGPRLEGYAVEPKKVSVTAEVPVNLLRKVQDLKTLFQVSPPPEPPLTMTTVNLTVTALPQPGHGPIKVLKVEPQTIFMRPPVETPPGNGVVDPAGGRNKQ